MVFRPVLPRWTSLHLTCYFHISSCLGRLSPHVTCGPAWELWQSYRIKQYTVPIASHLWASSRDFLVSQTKVSETDLTVHLQKAVLPAGFVMPARNLGMLVLAPPLSVLLVHAVPLPFPFSWFLLWWLLISASGLLRANCARFPSLQLLSQFIVGTLATFILMKCCFHPRMCTWGLLCFSVWLD